jgi:uncharacterized RDD family membrane protein YckC
MKLISVRLALSVLASATIVLTSSAGHARAQSASGSGLRASVALTKIVGTAQGPSLAVEQPEQIYNVWGRNVLRVGQEFVLKHGETVRDVVVVFSPATIEGYVRGDVTVVFGGAQIGSSAIIDGSLIVVGGNVTVLPGAAIHRDMVVVGGGLETPPNFVPGGQHVAIGAAALADRLRGVVPWIMEGLLLGRPIVPRLAWVWLIVFFVFLGSLALNLLFRDTVQMCADAIARRPFTTFLTGLLVLLLTGPVAVILAASVVGILVVPFVLCAIVVGWIIGKVGVSVRLGDSMVGQTPPASRLQSIRSLAIGSAAIYLIYMVPVLGFIAWALVGVTGLGAAALAFTSAYRRENPAPPKPLPPPPAPVERSVMSDMRVMSPSPNLASSEAFGEDVPPIARVALGIDDAGAITPVAPSDPTNLLAFPKAGFFERAAAFALDAAFVLIVCGMFDLLDRSPRPLIFLMLAYHIGFWAWKGTTFGGIVCQLRVIRLDGTPLRPLDALVRGVASIFSIVVVGLGCFWILKDEERQAWHDKIAGTYVVTVPRNWPLT